MSISTMQAVLSDSATDLTNRLKSRSFLTTDRSRTSPVPTLPASVGVKSPFINPTIIIRKIRTTRPISGREANRSRQVDRSPWRTQAGVDLAPSVDGQDEKSRRSSARG